MLILNSEHSLKGTQETFEFVPDFLGLPDYELDQVKPKSEYRYGSLNSGARRWSEEFFKPYNQRFYDKVFVESGW